MVFETVAVVNIKPSCWKSKKPLEKVEPSWFVAPNFLLDPPNQNSHLLVVNHVSLPHPSNIHISFHLPSFEIFFLVFSGRNYSRRLDVLVSYW